MMGQRMMVFLPLLSVVYWICFIILGYLSHIGITHIGHVVGATLAVGVNLGWAYDPLKERDA